MTLCARNGLAHTSQPTRVNANAVIATSTSDGPFVRRYPNNENGAESSAMRLYLRSVSEAIFGIPFAIESLAVASPEAREASGFGPSSAYKIIKTRIVP
jgi:hypothetical protein